MNQILASTTRTGKTIMILTCNLGSLGLCALRRYGLPRLRGASLTSRETHGRNPCGLIKEGTILETICQEERYMCIDLRNFMEDYGEKHEQLGTLRAQTATDYGIGLQWEALQGALVREIVRSKKYYQWCARMAALPEEPLT